MLIHLISDYIRDEKLRRRFAESPDAVLDSYGIAKGLASAVRANGLRGLAREVAAELEASSHAAHGKQPVLLWGPNTLQVESVSPSITHVGKDTELQVSGWQFGDRPQVAFETSSERVVAQLLSVSVGPDGQSVAVVQARFTRTGCYSAIVLNPTTQEQGTKPNALTVDAG